MAEPKTIYCPRCKRKVSVWDGRSSINVIANCKKCKKKVVYCVDTGEVKIKNIPERTTSSGMMFC